MCVCVNVYVNSVHVLRMYDMCVCICVVCTCHAFVCACVRYLHTAYYKLVLTACAVITRYGLQCRGYTTLISNSYSVTRYTHPGELFLIFFLLIANYNFVLWLANRTWSTVRVATIKYFNLLTCYRYMTGRACCYHKVL